MEVVITREYFGVFFRQIDLVQNFYGSFMIFGNFGRQFEIGQLKDAIFSMQDDTSQYNVSPCTI